MTRGIRRAFRASVLVAVSLVVCAGSSLLAHEAGTTRVTISISPSHTYDIEIVTDAASLAEKLAAVADAPFPSALSASALEHAITEGETDFRERVTVGFDGNSVRPDITVSVLPPVDLTAVPAATIHLTGTIPTSAREMTWRFGWTFAAYQLTTRHGTAVDAVRSVESTEANTSIPLAAPSMPTSRRLLDAARFVRVGLDESVPRGVTHVLFVLGVFLLAPRTRGLAGLLAVLAVANLLAIGLSTSGLVSVAPAALSALMAVSIAGVALLNVCRYRVAVSLPLTVFAGGLVHGFALAGALAGKDLTDIGRTTAAVAFGLGITLGQASVAAAAFMLIGWGWSRREWYHARVVVPASALIACSAFFWVVAGLGS